MPAPAREYTHKSDPAMLSQLREIAGDSKDLYPHGEYSVIYSTQTVFREGSSKGYALVRKPTPLAFAALAAKRFEEMPKALVPAERTMYLKKLAVLMEVAVRKKHDSLVLGALGCGAFRNLAEEIAQFFRVVLSCYQDHFTQIKFAILDHGGALHRTFQDVLCSLNPCPGTMAAKSPS